MRGFCGLPAAMSIRIPNFLHSNQKLRTLEISFEICSEAPGFNRTGLRISRSTSTTCPLATGRARVISVPNEVSYRLLVEQQQYAAWPA